MFSIYARWCSMSPIQDDEEFSGSTKNEHAGVALNSPDLNPIENLWSTMERKAAEQQPSSLLGHNLP